MCARQFDPAELQEIDFRSFPFWNTLSSRNIQPNAPERYSGAPCAHTALSNAKTWLWRNVCDLKHAKAFRAEWDENEHKPLFECLNLAIEN
jgi:hypothetical protein